MSADEVGRQAAGRQGRGLFCSVKGRQEGNWSSDDEDPRVGDEKTERGGGGHVGALEIY